MILYDERGRRFAHGYKETWPTSSYVTTEAVRSDYLLAHKQGDAEGAALQAKELRARGAAVPRLHKNPSRPAPANAVFFATTKGDGHQIIVTPYDAESYDFGAYSGGDKWRSGLLDADAVRKSIALELPNQKYVVKVDKLAKSNPKPTMKQRQEMDRLYEQLWHDARKPGASHPEEPADSIMSRAREEMLRRRPKKRAAKSNPRSPASLPGWRQLEIGYGHTVWLPVGNYAKITKHVDRDGTPAYYVTVDERFKRAWGTLKGAQAWAAEQFGGAKSNPSALTLTLTDQHGRAVQLPWRIVKDGRPGNEGIALRASFYTDPSDTTREWVSGSIIRDGKVIATWPRPMRVGKTMKNPRGRDFYLTPSGGPLPASDLAFIKKCAQAMRPNARPKDTGWEAIAARPTQAAVLLAYKPNVEHALFAYAAHNGGAHARFGRVPEGFRHKNPAPFYGAPMGYGSRSEAPDTTTPLLVRRVKLDSGGYASDGAYFGIGRPVYVVTDADTGSVIESLRAADFVDAKEKMRSKYPNAKVK